MKKKRNFSKFLNLSIEFRISNPVKPAVLGYNNADQRDLGIGLTAAVFE